MFTEFNNVLIALVFLLPGFLTSRLIAARTPAIGKAPSTFQETLESLLRSVLIHMVLVLLFYLVINYSIKNGAIFINGILQEGIQSYYSKFPLQFVTLLFWWLVASFLLATFWGYKWDPLEALFSRLVNNTGTKSEDIFYQFRNHVEKKRKSGEKYFQFWIQAKLKNGYVYQGEFYFVGYRQEGASRELVLANATFIPNSSQYNENIKPKYYDFVLIDMENCESIEILFNNNSPHSEDK